jgi:xanthine dehydrogenase YagR molybdenum-binding subunit
MTTMIGPGVARIEGNDKVRGIARYAGDLAIRDVVHAALVVSNVANGRIAAIDEHGAREIPGVIVIFTHGNFEKLQASDVLLLLQDERIWHAGQPVALVVAETVEQARRAASLVKIQYVEAPAIIRFEDTIDKAYPPGHVYRQPPDSRRGDPAKGLAEAAARIDQRYTTPTHNHSPIEPHAAVACWENESLTVYTTTQAVFATRAAIASALGMQPERVRVISALLGGGFCSKGRAWWPLLLLVAAASRRLGQPVRLELRREEMFSVVGNRQRTSQRVALGASSRGDLTAIIHEVVAQTSAFGEYTDPNGSPSRLLYGCPNVSVTHRLARANVPHPVAMRAPGEGTGTFALESAIDELAFELRMDPLAFRLQNFAGFDQHSNKPWSSNGLRECYRVASEGFGWSTRSIEPRTLRDGKALRGWGMASAYYPTYQVPAEAAVTLHADGTVIARCGTQDIGTGTYTVTAQLVAEALNIPVAHVAVELGDTQLPEGPPSFGSMGASSFTPAVLQATESLRARLASRAASLPSSPLYGAIPGMLTVTGERVANADGSVSVPVTDLVAREPGGVIGATGKTFKSEHADSYSSNAYGAVFVEVTVDEMLGRVRVSRVTAAYAAGRILNARTARSQYIGGLVFGIGMALHEETRFDPNLGRIVNGNLSDYLVPVHADVPDIEVRFVEEMDEHLGNGGVKGIGMLGTVGTAAAIANAVFHATGRRVRHLPIRLEDFL